MQVFEQYQQLAHYIGWTGDDARRVQSLGPLLSPYFVPLIDGVYAETPGYRQADHLITGGQRQIERLKRTLLSWLDELFSGQYDVAYVARRWDAGKQQVDIGLDQLHTNASLLRLRRGLLGLLNEVWQGDLSEQLKCRESLNMLLDLNRAIIDHAYYTEYARRQRTTERLAMIGKVANSIVEELRGPLDSTKDSLEFLRKTHEASPESRRAHLHRIDDQVRLAEKTVATLNDFARLPLENFQPLEIVECLRGAVSADALPESICVCWDVPVAKLNVLGDPAQLRIVFSHLIRCAQGATCAGGSLRLGAMPDGDAVYVTIEHLGVCRVNASHSAMHASPTERHPGLGLALSILHDIVYRHRGALTISTQEARITATLRLPAHPACP